MQGGVLSSYVKNIQAISLAMEQAVPGFKRRKVFELAHPETGLPAASDERPYTLFYANCQQWALVMSVGNPDIMAMADHILETLNGAAQ